MTAYTILRTSKLKTFGNIGGSLSHNYRERITPNADPDLLKKNEHDLQSSEEVMQAIKNRLPEKIRKDNVLCIEYLITASKDWSGWNTSDEKQYFEDARKWLKENFGEENLISTSIHRDETTPHLIAYVVPLDEETGKLNAKKWLGGKAKLSKMQTDFAEQVEYLGLSRGVEGSKAEHVSIKQYYASVENTLNTPGQSIDLDAIELPNSGLFESKQTYAVRVLNEVLPDYRELSIKAFEKDQNARELNQLRKQIVDAKPYLDAVKGLPFDMKQQVLSVVRSESERLHREYEHQKQNEEKQYEQLKHTFYEFTNYIDQSLIVKKAAEKSLETDYKLTEKWLKKNKYTHNDLRTGFGSTTGGYTVKNDIERPDFYITPNQVEKGYEQAYLDFKRDIGKYAENSQIDRVVPSLKVLSVEEKVLNDIDVYESSVKPVIDEYCADIAFEAHKASLVHKRQKEEIENANRKDQLLREAKEAYEKTYRDKKRADQEYAQMMRDSKKSKEQDQVKETQPDNDDIGFSM